MTRRFRMLTMAVVLTLLFAACGDDGDDSAEGSDTTAAATDTTAAAGDDGDGGGGTEVSIADFTFDPGDLTVAIGDTVTWSNADGATHTVTSDDDAFDSGDLGSGATFEQAFDEAGDFAYHCDIHPQMAGTITVE